MKPSQLQCLLALAAGLTASAQPPQHQRGDRQPPPVPPLIAIFDTNHDKVLSAEEIQAAADSLGKLDHNGDGKITPEELRLPPPDREKQPKRPPGKPPIPPVIAALDVDKDGTVSAAELEKAPDSLKALDKDGDGALSPEELHPHHPPIRPDGQGEGNHPQGPPPEEEARTQGVE